MVIKEIKGDRGIKKARQWIFKKMSWLSKEKEIQRQEICNSQRMRQSLIIQRKICNEQ